jgi:hypothetical protein
MKRLFSALAHLVLASIFVTALCIVLLDWVGGCGESYVYADGTRHLGECLGRELFLSNLGGIFK